ncbi:MAG: caspase family protein [Alphaproteobacteria bacterium]|nr:caspase family protein [Alphaproteobacteria bacterium]
MKQVGLGLLLAATAFVAAPAAMGQVAPAPQPIAIGQTVSGELSPNDAQRRSGKFEDVYLIEGHRGQRLQLDLSSDAFDSYLVVTGPEGFNLANDDGDENSLNSRLVLQFPADGSYRISATTYRAGETGAYRLRASAPAANVAVTMPVSAQPIQIGAAINGRLAQGDGRAADGSFEDRYRFHAVRGQRVTISLTADKMDTVLRLSRPDGTEDVSDDTRLPNGQTSTNSRLDTVLAEDGDYVITATSYRANETGDYRLTLAPSPGHPRQIGVPGGARVIALLVGVSDYGGRINDLPNTDEDARQLYNSLRSAGLLHPASVVLTNAEATTKNVREAFARAAAAVGPNDTFLFFFSGHGDQVDVPVSARELDGRAETIELRDAAMTDAELEPLFGSVHGRLSIVALDSCFSGGFRNLINRPNVMGLFSSEEDLTSLVASQFKAGGFLAYFLREGLTGAADDDGDHIVTAGELSTYVRRRFRREGDIPATTREDENNYQNLLVERGGLQVEDVIVRLAGGPQVAAAPPPRPRPAALQTEPAKRR